MSLPPTAVTVRDRPRDVVTRPPGDGGPGAPDQAGGAAAPREPDLRMRQVMLSWWPLAGSWLLMGIEMPAVSAVIARLADPTINLAAFGGIVFPLEIGRAHV